jgi:hypothetical protein
LAADDIMDTVQGHCANGRTRTTSPLTLPVLLCDQQGEMGPRLLPNIEDYCRLSWPVSDALVAQRGRVSIPMNAWSNAMPRFLFPLALLAAGLLLTAVQADDTPGEEAIKEAITILEARKAQAEKKEDKDKIARAITDLEKLLPAAKKAVGKEKPVPDLAKLITPAMLKKKFAGKAAFNPKTSELTLVYDFTAKDQLKDFDLGDAKPKVQKVSLELASGEGVTHIVDFQTVRVTDLKGPVPFDLTVAASRCSVKVGGTILGKEAKLSAGKVILSGGTGGTVFSKLSVTGTVNEEWANGFFKE